MGTLEELTGKVLGLAIMKDLNILNSHNSGIYL